MKLECNLCVDQDADLLPHFKFVNMSIFKIPAPLKGPTVNVTATGKTTAQLKWNEIPIEDQQGFLTNYTIVYKKGDNELCKENQF